MIWGCLTAQGLRYLCWIKEGLDAELYRQILDDEFMDTLEHYKLKKKYIIFQHDNDPKHTAILTKQWFVDHKVTVLKWPAQSPDLNPIEHLWDEIDRQLRKLSHKISNSSDLFEKLETVWNSIDLECCTKLYESMLDRIQRVLKSKGGYI